MFYFSYIFLPVLLKQFFPTRILVDQGFLLFDRYSVWALQPAPESKVVLVDIAPDRAFLKDLIQPVQWEEVCRDERGQHIDHIVSVLRHVHHLVFCQGRQLSKPNKIFRLLKPSLQGVR